MAVSELLLDSTNPVIAQQREVISSQRTEQFIEDWLAARNVEEINDSWKPHKDLLPNRGKDPDFREKEEAIFLEAQRLPRELVIATVFHHVTEENLPGYMRALNMFMPDSTGTSPLPSARWQRAWTRQEKRHGQSSHGYLYLSGRVNMAELDIVIGHQIQNGFNMNVETLYDCFYYTADQERKTKNTHGRNGRRAHQEGAQKLSQVCTAETGDEAIHERFYVDLFGELFDHDANGAMIAFRDMAKRETIMPSRLIDDGRMGSTAMLPKMFLSFGRVEEALDIFDFYQDSADDMAYFMNAWGIEHRSVEGEAAKAQEELPIILQDLREAKVRRSTTFRRLYLSAFDNLVPPVETPITYA